MNKIRVNPQNPSNPCCYNLIPIIMKRIILLLFILASYSSFAQQTEYLWPLVGVEKGTQIVSKPQGYIGDEFNFANLYITAPEGTAVVSPVTGRIVSFGYMLDGYSYQMMVKEAKMKMLQESKRYDYALKVDLEKEENPFEFMPSIDTATARKYVTQCIGIEIEPGKIIHISGFITNKEYKTGEKINRGDILGTIVYSTQKIKVPSLAIAISVDTKPADPMTPFGIPSTFQPPKISDIQFLTKEQATKDIQLLFFSLAEGYPGLYDYLSKSEVTQYFEQIVNNLPDTIPIYEFEGLLQSIFSKINDSHLGLKSSQLIQKKERYYPSITFGVLNNELIVTQTDENHKAYYGRRISEIDGLSADAMIHILHSYVNLYDGLIESYPQYAAFDNAYLKYINYHPNASPKADITLKFDDDKKVIFQGIKDVAGKEIAYYPNRKEFQNINSRLILDKLNDTTAYMGLHSFALNETDVEAIAFFIKELESSLCPNLIIDVRNNNGGNIEVLTTIFSYLAQQPFYTSLYEKVNKQDSYDFFAYTDNYASNMKIFTDYQPIEGKEGFYKIVENQIYPDSNINYRGKIYLLINENSRSAAASFAGYVKKYRRGVIIGRETASTYHQMNANKFAHLRLPNSEIFLTIPLVTMVFDTIIDDVFPWGRGVLPHFVVPFTIEELDYKNGDAILNYALSLIEQGIYISEDNKFFKFKNILSISISVIILGIIAWWTMRRRRNKEHGTHVNNEYE